MKRIIVVLSALACLVGCNSKKTELHVYNWSDYISPDVIERFEIEYDCLVVVDTFDSNEAMYAKLKAGAAGWDIILPSSYQVSQLVKEHMLEKLDLSKIPNVTNSFDHSYDSQILDPTLSYSIPYVVTYTGFLYSKSDVEGMNVNSWKILSESKLKGKISLLDDMREVIGAGLMYNGYSLNSENENEVAKAVDTILKWKKNIRKFDAESYRNEVPSHMISIGHGYSSDSAQAIIGEGQTPRSDIGFTLPLEGFTIAWDEIVILKSAPQKELAYKFINYLYSDENALENMKYVCGIMPSKKAIEQLPKEMKDFFIPPHEVMLRGQVLKSFIDKPQIQELYNKAWDKIKAIEK